MTSAINKPVNPKRPGQSKAGIAARLQKRGKKPKISAVSRAREILMQMIELNEKRKPKLPD